VASIGPARCEAVEAGLPALTAIVQIFCLYEDFATYAPKRTDPTLLTDEVRSMPQSTLDCLKREMPASPPLCEAAFLPDRPGDPEKYILLMQRYPEDIKKMLAFNACHGDVVPAP
jgi:hypothetical protein